MVSRLLDGVLPGIRDLRSPLVAGALWLLFVWLLWGENIRASDTPYIEDAKSVAEAAPDWAAASGVLVAVYLVGLLSATGVRPIARTVESVAGAIALRFTWQRFAWRTIELQRRQVARAHDGLENARKLHEAGETGPETAHEARARLSDNLERLTALKSEVRWRRLVPRTDRTEKLFGRPLTDNRPRVAEDLLNAAYERGSRQQLSGSATRIDVSDVVRHVPDTYRLLAEVEPDPLDIIHATDPSFFQVLDRERAEREFRLEVGAPALALTIYAAIEISPWLWVAVGLAAIMFVAAAHRVDQGVRVMKYRCLSTFLRQVSSGISESWVPPRRVC